VPQNSVAGTNGVYVTGWACDSQDKLRDSGEWLAGLDIFTVAYNLDGSRRWVAKFSGPGGAHDAIGDDGRGIALSPSGDRLYVTGGQNMGLGGTPGDFRFVGDIVTIAYDTATGAELWTATYHGPAVGMDLAEQVAVSEDGKRVYVMGESQAPDLPSGASGGSDAVVLSYDADTGERDWVSRYHAPGSTRNNMIAAGSIAVRGSRVYTAGTYGGPSGGGYEVLVIEDDRAQHRGVQRWVALSNPQLGFKVARGSLAATDGGIFFTGTKPSSVAPPQTCPPQQTSGVANAEYATVSLDPGTGAVEWMKTYSGAVGGNNASFGLASDDAGSRIYVTGQASGPAPSCAVSIATVAYDGKTGDQLWSDYQQPFPGSYPQGFAITAAADGSRVYVAGLEYHLTTLGYRGDSRVLAYDSAGALKWSGRYNSAPAGPALDLDSYGYFLELSPDASRVYLTTQVNRRDQVMRTSKQLYGTVAYDTAP
jgi:PQQ-like domain